MPLGTLGVEVDNVVVVVVGGGCVHYCGIAHGTYLSIRVPRLQE